MAVQISIPLSAEAALGHIDLQPHLTLTARQATVLAQITAGCHALGALDAEPHVVSEPGEAIRYLLELAADARDAV